MSASVAPAEDFSTVRTEELRAIAELRKRRLDREDNNVDSDLFGLAFSGGGIRSATFNLGILQGLAKCGVLPHVDYLSTVSGGGYVGAWLAAYIKRSAPLGRAIDVVTQKLASPDEPNEIRYLRQFSNYLTPRTSIFSADTWSAVAIWSRNTLLNLLTIVAGTAALLLLARFVGLLFAGRVTFIFGPFMPIGLLLAISCLAIGQNLRHFWVRESSIAKLRDSLWPMLADIALRTGEMVSPLLTAIAVRLRTPVTYVARKTFFWRGAVSTRKWVQLLIVLPSLGAAVLLAEWFAANTLNDIGRAARDALAGIHGFAADSRFVPWAIVSTCALTIYFLIIQWTGGYFGCYTSEPAKGSPWAAFLHLVWMPIVSAFVTATLLYLFGMGLDASEAIWRPWVAAVVGPPAILLIFAVGVIIHIGLMGRDLPDGSREWFGRLRAWTMMYTVAWMILFGIAIYGPFLVAKLGAWWATAASTGWVAATISGLFAANSDRTSGKEEDTRPSVRKRAMEALAKAVPWIFLFGFLMAVSFGLHALLSYNLERAPLNSAAGGQMDVQLKPGVLALTVRDGKAESGGQYFRALEHWYACDLTETAAAFIGTEAGGCPASGRNDYVHTRLDGLFLICLSAALVLAWRVDINDFSMHHFYKNRLVRCYLGASRNGRSPHAFTAFDPDDDVRLQDLRPSKDYQGPYPIINAALNLSGGNQLAWQERQAASYIFTPLFCGYDKPAVDAQGAAGKDRSQVDEFGYRRTENHAYDGQLHTGTAIAISGAAANPNSGYHTSPAVAFFLTVFNARLGWWIGNPADDETTTETGPRFGLLYLTKELLGLTDTSTEFVNVSDGGHFENLGIYELVRRECRYIIACDAEQDRAVTFGGLGNAIRKCRSDFGAEIDIDVDGLRPVSGFSKAHCVLGTIRYKNGNEGHLLYVKSSVTGDEPRDVLEYRDREPAFPHQSTGDQWFDESQFESYRSLGEHIAVTTFRQARLRGGRDAVKTFFDDLNDHLYPTSTVNDLAFTRHTQKYSELMNRLSSSEELAHLDEAAFSTWPAMKPLPRPVIAQRKARYWADEAIQLMENVYMDLDLDSERQRANPDNAGWMRVFRRWAVNDLFQEVWEMTRDSYGSRFRRFFEEELVEAEIRSQFAGSWKPGAPTATGWPERLDIRRSANGVAIAVVSGASPVNAADVTLTGTALSFKAAGISYIFRLPHLRRSASAVLSADTLPGTQAFERQT